MRHRKTNRLLGRPTDHRLAMLRNLVTSLVEHGRVTTTDARAKELRRIADRLVTLGKRNDLHSRRLAARTLRTNDSVDRLFEDIAPGFTEREGGYTRIMKLGKRHGDGADLSIIEFMPAGAVSRKSSSAPSVAPSVSPTVAVAPSSKESFEEE